MASVLLFASFAQRTCVQPCLASDKREWYEAKLLAVTVPQLDKQMPTDQGLQAPLPEALPEQASRSLIVESTSHIMYWWQCQCHHAIIE
jgi:hypothetical protein